MGNDSEAPDYYPPNLFDCRSLFLERPGKENWGFPAHSSVLLEGPPGSGKTFMALSFARSVLFKGKAEEGNHPCLRDNHVIYYISAELNEKRLIRNFRQTGWFGEEDTAFKGWNKRPDARFALITARVDLNRPVPNSEELINQLLVQLKKNHSRRCTDNTHAIIIVDSLTALLRDCAHEGDRRRQTHEFIHRLTTVFGEDQLALTFFISEESKEESRSTSVEDYVVDFVFRLGMNKTAGGRRLRVFEVIKSHGAHLHQGMHTWAMITKEGAKGVLSQTELIGDLERLSLGFESAYTLRNRPRKELNLRTVSAASNLKGSGESLVIVALVNKKLRIRIFNSDGKMVVDKAEDKLDPGKELEFLKKRLKLLENDPDAAQPKEEEKQRIIDKATSIAGHTLPNKKWATAVIFASGALRSIGDLQGKAKDNT